MSDLLQPALRQYRHNNSDEFVFGYDLKETDKIVAQLEACNTKLEEYKKAALFCWESLPEYKKAQTEITELESLIMAMRSHFDDYTDKLVYIDKELKRIKGKI